MVWDYDGLLFGRVEVRLQLVAALELNWEENPAGGAAAKVALEGFISDAGDVVWHLNGTTASSNRPVGVCVAAGKIYEGE